MQHVYLCNKVVNNQTPSPRLGVSLLRENTNIFTNVSYLCILYICVYKIYSSMNLFKGKIPNTYLEPVFITLKGTHDLYLFRTYKCIWHNAVLFA